MVKPAAKDWKKGYKLRRDCKNRVADLVTQFPRIPEGVTVEYMLDALVGFVDKILNDFEHTLYEHGNRPQHVAEAMQKRFEQQHKFEIEVWTQCRNRLGKIEDTDPKAWAKARKVVLICLEDLEKLERSSF